MLTLKKSKIDSEQNKYTEAVGVSIRGWPVCPERADVKWFPAGSRLIGLVRANVDKFVLPPAVVRKASWRE